MVSPSVVEDSVALDSAVAEEELLVFAPLTSDEAQPARLAARAAAMAKEMILFMRGVPPFMDAVFPIIIAGAVPAAILVYTLSGSCTSSARTK